MLVKIALVEDDRAVREKRAAFIDDSFGFRCVCCCPDSRAALRDIPAARPDVVLMDINMPGMSGIECTGRLHELLPDLHILVLTVCADPDRIFRAIQAGASGYLLKRTEPAKLLEGIREVISGGAPMSPDVARKIIGSIQAAGAAQRSSSGDGFSEREKEVLQQLARGYVAKEVADHLGISFDTVRTYIKRIYTKLHVHSRAEAVARYMRSRNK